MSYFSATGLIVGNGAAINISLGWYPDWVKVTNLTDGSVYTENTLSRLAFAFTSGGTTEIVTNSFLTGATSGSQFYVEKVLLSSGTWAAGTAAGFLITDEQTGVIATENVYLPGETDSASVTAAFVSGVATSTAAAGVVTTSNIIRYVGSATAGKGFTIGSVVATEAKLLHWIAFRSQDHMYGQ
jgi:hypothetical protein